MPNTELSRLQPWYAKLLRLEGKLGQEIEDSSEFRVTLNAHKTVERAVAPLQTGQVGSLWA